MSGEGGVERLEVTVRDEENREYERAVAAIARLDGPEDALEIERTYEALPFHNDVVHPEGVDSNDEFLDRPDAVHVHTQYYRPEDEDYLVDRHETWQLDDPGVLGDPEQFREACERHHLGDLAAEYEWATDEEAREERNGPDRTAPGGWNRLD